jgi:hypothetical protein
MRINFDARALCSSSSISVKLIGGTGSLGFDRFLVAAEKNKQPSWK